MPRFLAVDWDGVEVRFVFGNQNKEKLSVLKIGSEPIAQPTAADLEPTSPKDKSPISPEIGAALKRLLQTHQVSGGNALFAIAGSSAEVMQFALPPSKEEEIPELLKNQAIRDMPNFSETYAIDFLTLGEEKSGPRKVLAIAQSRLHLRAIQNLGKPARCKPIKIEYRPAATAEFVLGSGLLEEDAPPTLIVSLLADELDLVVLKSQRIISIRSIKLPTTDDSQAIDAKVFQEIARTCAVGLGDDSEEQVESVLLLCGETENEQLREKLHQQGLDVRTVDPLATARVQTGQQPTSPGRYAALLGMVFNEATGKKPAIDLLHPKSKPQPPNYAGIAILSLLLFGLILGGLYYWNSSSLKKMEQDRDDLKKKYEELLGQHNQWVRPYQMLRNAQAFDQRDVVWLDAIRGISPYFPEQQDMVVSQMNYISGPIPNLRNGANFSGRINIVAMVRDPVVIQSLKQNLEATRMYMVSTTTPTQNPAGGGYPWIYQFTIACYKVPDTKYYLQFLPAEVQAESLKNPENYQ